MITNRRFIKKERFNELSFDVTIERTVLQNYQRATEPAASVYINPSST